ncbi:MAG: DUF1549 and DUF1553 domain-containing protein [Mariniblastus sp.]|nr:DUF1549 and DUF1553 domain-containing protein [Mariniblastus sp.]
MNQLPRMTKRFKTGSLRPNFLVLCVIVFSLNFAFTAGMLGQNNRVENNPAENQPAALKFSTLESPEFTRHVLPILSKLGCNSGACHGALAGKGGFRLSLNGYNPKGDHFTITQQSLGRRIEISDPGRSLILTKPTGTLPHKGGLRLETDSVEYKILSDWIAKGALGPSTADAKLLKLEVEPKTIVLSPNESANVSVFAHYSDGKKENVTRWAKFDSSNTPVVDVDKDGTLSVVGRGEASIVVWFSSLLEVSRVQLQFPNEIAPEVFKNAPKRNFIDELVLEKLEQLRLAPSPRCDDSTFIRRAFLDTIGMLPTPKEVQDFQSNQSQNKRDELIDGLLQREEFNDYWSYRWSDVFLISGKRLRPQAVKAYYQWLRKKIETNAPWDQVVREVITAQGSSYTNGATNFFALHQTPEDMAENVSQAFLGLSIGCAKCHNHPLEKWTNDQYYAMANLFSRVRAKGWGGDARNGDGLRTLFLATNGELIQPLTGAAQPPTPLDGKPLEFDDPTDRREHLADWLTSPENPYFSRSVANRIWANFMGRGLVENVDDMRTSNPATNEPLLNALAAHLSDNQFDLKTLMREILRSETYQRSSEVLPHNKQDDRFYSRFLPRRLMAEVLLDAISQVSEVPTAFVKIEHKGADIRKTTEYPLGTRATELYDSAVLSSFLSKFGRNSRDIVCECERTNKPSLVQVLHIANGSTINEKLKSKKSCVDIAISKPTTSNEDIIREAFLKTVAREPTKHESNQLLQIIEQAGADDRRSAIEDLYWSLMSSREFLFQH